MRFKFRLEKALHFAKMREKRKQIQLQRGMQALTQMEAGIVGLREQIRASLVSASSKPEGMLFHSAKAEADLELALQMEQKLAEESAHLEKCRRDLLQLTMRRKALEKLRERKLQEHKLSERRFEQKELDEVSNRKFYK